MKTRCYKSVLSTTDICYSTELGRPTYLEPLPYCLKASMASPMLSSSCFLGPMTTCHCLIGLTACGYLTLFLFITFFTVSDTIPFQQTPTVPTTFGYLPLVELGLHKTFITANKKLHCVVPFLFFQLMTLSYFSLDS